LGLIIYGEYPISVADAEYFSAGIGLSAKYKFLSTKKLRPYVLYGFSVCFTKYEFIDPGGIKNETDNPALPGLVAGLGFELDITNNIALFIQSGYTKVLSAEGDGIPPIGAVYGLFGMNLNLFKSKNM
jgi:hypothetical protein